jgi:hypothetical protein
MDDNPNKDISVSQRLKINIDFKYAFICTLAIFQIVFGLTQNTPSEILIGLYKILTNPDTLITDYIGLGNMGAAFVNSGILTLMFVVMLLKMKHKLNGVSIAALFTIMGFALFGKNLMNVWFIIIGVYLYSRYKKEKFNKYLIAALFGTALAPVVSEIMFSTNLQYSISIPLGMASGIFLGFILSPLASALINVHQGFNLYNIGFTAGMVGTIYISILRSYGFVPAPQFIWTKGNNVVLGIYLAIIFVLILVVGLYLNRFSLKNYKDILHYSGRLVTDFVQLEGMALSMINMGITGLITLSYILIIKGDLNGPTIGGIFTIVGFSAFGKHPRNILPIFFGVFLGSLTKIFNINDPSIQLAALFGTALAPIAGEFGVFWGTIAAFLHSSVVLNVGYLHGGLNLYNNGFSAGIVAAILVPIIGAFGKGEMK